MLTTCSEGREDCTDVIDGLTDGVRELGLAVRMQSHLLAEPRPCLLYASDLHVLAIGIEGSMRPSCTHWFASGMQGVQLR